MSPPQVRPVFLERQSYRQRRLIDAVRLLPVLGLILLAVPLLWPEGGDAGLGEGGAGQGLPVSRAMIYLFSAWAGLALASGLLVWRLSVEEVERLDGATSPGPLPDPLAEFTRSLPPDPRLGSAPVPPVGAQARADAGDPETPSGGRDGSGSGAAG